MLATRQPQFLVMFDVLAAKAFDSLVMLGWRAAGLKLACFWAEYLASRHQAGFKQSIWTGRLNSWENRVKIGGLAGAPLALRAPQCHLAFYQFSQLHDHFGPVLVSDHQLHVYMHTHVHEYIHRHTRMNRKHTRTHAAENNTSEYVELNEVGMTQNSMNVPESRESAWLWCEASGNRDG